MAAKTEEQKKLEKLLVADPANTAIWLRWIQTTKDKDTRIELLRKKTEELAARPVKDNNALWLEYINSTLGSEQFEAVFSRACRQCRPETIYTQTACMAQKKHPELCRKLCSEILQRFPRDHKSIETALRVFSAMLDAEEARRLFKQVLSAAAAEQHLKLLLLFAQLEFHTGHPEHGRTWIETALNQHKNKTDLWFAYLELELGQKDKQKIRVLFDRILSLPLSSKKARYILKKYLLFEKEHGTPQRKEHVENLARHHAERQRRH